MRLNAAFTTCNGVLVKIHYMVGDLAAFFAKSFQGDVAGNLEKVGFGVFDVSATFCVVGFEEGFLSNVVYVLLAI